MREKSGRPPSTKTVVDYKVLLAEVRATRHAFPNLKSDKAALEKIRRELGGYRHISETALKSRFGRARAKERAEKEAKERLHR